VLAACATTQVTGRQTLYRGKVRPLGPHLRLRFRRDFRETGSSTIHGKAMDTAREIAAQLEPRFREQGWIPGVEAEARIDDIELPGDRSPFRRQRGG
jgi:hypothetical protein